MSHGSGQLIPSTIEAGQEEFTLGGEGIILARRALGRFAPFVAEQPIVLQAGELRVKGSFDHYQLSILQTDNDVRGIRSLLPQKQHHAILQHSLPHLRFCVVNIHTSFLNKTISYFLSIKSLWPLKGSCKSDEPPLQAPSTMQIYAILRYFVLHSTNNLISFNDSNTVDNHLLELVNQIVKSLNNMSSV